MSKSLPPIDAVDREFTASEIQDMKDDVAELKKLGFVVPSISVHGNSAPKYDLKPPKGAGMHEWRLALERAGFDVVSNFKPEKLGFSASRRSVKGQGWT